MDSIFQLAAGGLFQKDSLDQCTKEEINQRSCLRSTLLHYAVLGENADTVRYLLEKGVPVNGINVYQESALHWCCKIGNMAIVRLLLQHGASSRAIDSDGNTLLHWAAEYDHEHIVLLLLQDSEASLSLTTRNSQNLTPSEVAKKSKSRMALRALLRAITR